jgi:hypothetical protein
MPLASALCWVLLGYVISVLIETPVLILGLSARHPLSRRIFCGVWLTACTYPIIAFVFPVLIDPVRNRGVYLLAAESFAPVAECALFWMAFIDRAPPARRSSCRDMTTILCANLASFLIGEALPR